MTGRELREMQAQMDSLVHRSVERSHLEAAARRHQEEAERLRDRCSEQGLDESAEWFETACAAAQGGRASLKEEELK
jgi:hypothetical protein